MVVHLPDDDKPYKALGLDRIKEIAEKAERLGVNVALENLHNLTNLSYMLKQVDSPHIGFCYDCCHHYHYYPNYDLLSMYSSRLMALHLHDYDGNSIHRLPFNSTISKTNYQGATALESMNWDYKDLLEEEFLHRAFEKAKRLGALRFSN
jgi:sugar phosphate isomerase/epimerase